MIVIDLPLAMPVCQQAVKQCSRCKEEKPLNLFKVRKNGVNYTTPWSRRDSYCRPCWAKYSREWVKKNPEATRRKNKAWRERHPEQQREYWVSRYGITVAEYEMLLKLQNSVCAICSQPPGDIRLAVDHDHATGYVRGLLCKNCNLGIGRLQENPSFLRRAADYLETSADK